MHHLIGTRVTLNAEHGTIKDVATDSLDDMRWCFLLFMDNGTIALTSPTNCKPLLAQDEQPDRGQGPFVYPDDKPLPSDCDKDGEVHVYQCRAWSGWCGPTDLDDGDIWMPGTGPSEKLLARSRELQANDT